MTSHLRITLSVSAATAGAALFLSGYWAGSAGGSAATHGFNDSRPAPDWFLPIADAYDRNPKVTPDFDFAQLYAGGRPEVIRREVVQSIRREASR